MRAGSRLTSEEREELRRLRRENRILTEESDILKKRGLLRQRRQDSVTSRPAVVESIKRGASR